MVNCMTQAQHACTCTGLISLDESDVEGDALATRPVAWRTDDASEYFRLLDEHWKAGMMSQQKKSVCVPDSLSAM